MIRVFHKEGLKVLDEEEEEEEEESCEEGERDRDKREGRREVSRGEDPSGESRELCFVSEPKDGAVYLFPPLDLDFDFGTGAVD